ncbi:NACHT, LRR and PYD domains-containing protein 13-like [Clupea harengus]|uniref:NACHT, LRR and PYD domains-containing protein 13-like n=1 Tax=Clupea harengus TaxID=7950 RepID=A0A8M1KUI8_CLUHA|nr:NACHT, LRR and PYD domains-containing protein 13-like [Clupea harengus]
MACSNQSAVDFIKNAWSLLVDHLKNQELIADKLKELKVFNIDNVREVTSEKNPSHQTRNILEFVTKKGEKASYLFLKVLESERNRTLPKNFKPDLHQWISCFSFREEPSMQPTGSRPCQLYQSQLKTKAQTILKTHTKQIKSVLGCGDVEPFFYEQLVLDREEQRCPVPTKINLKSKKYKKCRTKKLSAYIPLNKPKLSPEDLLKYNGEDILLVGKPGIGKTTTTLEMINLWTNMTNRRLNYLFYFDETTLSVTSSLESLLFDAYVQPASSDRKEVLRDIEENSEHVIIIFDGIKDVPSNSLLHKIMNKELLPDAKVVLTCRPEYEEILSEREVCRVCVQGFSQESIQAYMSHVLRSKPDAVSLIMGNPELRSLCHVPVHALMVAACMLFPSAEAPNLCTATTIYLNIFRHVMKKCQQGLRLTQLDNFIQRKREKILDLCKLGFNAIKQKSIVLQDCDDKDIELNFLTQFVLRVGPTKAKTYCTFLHNTMQEFFTALWLLDNPEDIDGVLQDCKNEAGKHMRPVIPFLSGLLSEKNVDEVKCLFQEEHIKRLCRGFHGKLFSAFLHTDAEHELADGVIPEDDFLFLCQCLFELQSPQACSVFLRRINYHCELMDGCLDPYQCCAVSYVIRQSKQREIVLDLENCDVSEQLLKLILDCRQHFR